ncbi:23S rRNA (pseudouridine(1915)-N(3))-methyltransferase RlmH [Paracoccus sp. Z118]|uniref:23S rRNA (pseudouridine(1915)-N(3))-methyltransferase RlmH n=1 Tax=Paracoccus sp. Z118 TaxID=2851017 RepID=UPI001C2BC905|nr:23S rRNA (pseudouridine(1915)-N(3))-methyltransferase RlmH [Paracoccus sp. Z118]MBV0890258.1 23S rRNA (pseudouridine(1915)-N(3))-methyltransferase RlmH [Paracoccus sp. Z118]
MRIRIAAVGRLPARAPEAGLINDYLTRLNQTGRALGLGPASVAEVEDRRGGGMPAEAALLARQIPDGAAIIALDERGRLLSSPDFAAQLGRWRDDGRPETVLLIGGADGLDPALRDRADLVLSFGQMVWPHMLARVMLAEQLYRAATILAGSPYHRA